MQLAVHVLLIAAGAFLFGNAALSLWAARKLREFQDNWILSPLASRWGAPRIRGLLIVNSALTGLLGVAAVTVGVCGITQGT